MYGAVTEQPVSHRGQTRYSLQDRKGKRVQCDCDGECQDKGNHCGVNPFQFKGSSGSAEPKAVGEMFNEIHALGESIVSCQGCLDVSNICLKLDCEVAAHAGSSPWLCILIDEFVGDGDATVTKKINKVYKHHTVIRTPCSNHLVKY